MHIIAVNTASIIVTVNYMLSIDLCSICFCSKKLTIWSWKILTKQCRGHSQVFYMYNTVNSALLLLLLIAKIILIKYKLKL